MVIMTDVVKGSCVYHESFGFGTVILVLAIVEVVVMFDRMNLFVYLMVQR